MIGTREWLARTGGALTRRERLAQQAAAVASLTSDAPSRVRFRFTRGVADVAASAPDTDLVRATVAWAQALHEPWLWRHGLRTWEFARIFGHVDGLLPDDEALYLACLLHDVGLTAEHRVPTDGPGDSCRCFAAHGAHVSEAALLDLGASPLLASEVADAIGMHLNARSEPTAGPTAILLNAGAALDVVGLRASDVGREAVRAVVQRHDRAGFADDLLAVLRQENAARPDARMASLFAVGMGQAIALNPLNRL